MRTKHLGLSAPAPVSWPPSKHEWPSLDSSNDFSPSRRPWFGLWSRPRSVHGRLSKQSEQSVSAITQCLDNIATSSARVIQICISGILNSVFSYFLPVMLQTRSRFLLPRNANTVESGTKQAAFSDTVVVGRAVEVWDEKRGLFSKIW